jgi:peroxiredoxin
LSPFVGVRGKRCGLLAILSLLLGSAGCWGGPHEGRSAATARPSGLLKAPILGAREQASVEFESGELESGELEGDALPGTVVPRRPRLSQAWLGLQFDPSDPGAQVQRVFDSSPAEETGVRAGDVIVSVDGRAVARASEVGALVAAHHSGDQIVLRWTRGDLTLEALVALDSSPDPEDIARLMLVNRRAPEIQGVVAFQGDIASLSDARGQVFVLEFWASYCPPCRTVGEIVQSWFDEYRARGFTALGVTGDPALRGSEVARARKMSYPLASDSRGTIARAYAAREIPMVVLVDRRGYVRDVALGYDPERFAELRQQIDRLLSEGP